jgi:hypothetical protein
MYSKSNICIPFLENLYKGLLFMFNFYVFYNLFLYVAFYLCLSDVFEV